MTDGASPEWLQIWALFLEVHACVLRRLEADMKANEGLPLTWFDVLIQLNFAPGGQLRMHDLLPNLMLTRSGLTRRIDRMEAAALVRRTGCSDDARGVVVALTPHGRSRLQHVAPVHAQRIQTYFAQHLTDEELKTFSAVFQRVLTALDSMT
ncbi:MAG: MarR family transcriptional regulator [Chloroflexota bacterium]|nr:MarR family transcriptional regulator [Chloroflexota bacterium]